MRNFFADDLVIISPSVKGLQRLLDICDVYGQKGPFKCYVTQMGVGGVTFFGKKRYEGVRYNVISITRGWVGVQFPGEKRYVTLEWRQNHDI